MASIQLHDGKVQPIPVDKALAVWQCLSGSAAMTKAQAEYCRRVKRVYLNWRDAPDDYIEKYIRELLPSILGDWVVDALGRPVRPATDEAWKFARRWGLWEGGPTLLVTGKQVQMFEERKDLV